MRLAICITCEQSYGAAFASHRRKSLKLINGWLVVDSKTSPSIYLDPQ